MARYAILPVSFDWIVMMCKGHTPETHFTITIDNHGLPDDAMAVGMTERYNLVGDVALDALGRPTVVGLVVESRYFEDVPYGVPYPVLEAPVFTKHWHEAPVVPSKTSLDTATPSE